MKHDPIISPVLMRLEYSCTHEDYQQARAARRTRAANRLTAVGCGVLLTGAVALFLMVGMVASRIEDPFWTGVAASIFLLMLGLLGICAMFWIWLAGRERQLRRSMWRTFFTMLVTILLCYAATNFVSVPAPSPSPRPVSPSSPPTAGIVLLLIWCMPVIVMAIAIVCMRKEVFRTNFENQPTAGQATITEVAAHGLTIQAGEICRIEYRWAALYRWTETRDLFVLFTSPEQFEMIPKRAFANRPQIEDFRRLLQTHASDPDQPRAGFEVTSVRALPASGDQSA
jgi:hypothetical protein